MDSKVLQILQRARTEKRAGIKIDLYQQARQLFNEYIIKEIKKIKENKVVDLLESCLMVDFI